ncbi:MAG: hypothetical protein QXG48_00295 [Thermofilaceae archaeon]
MSLVELIPLLNSVACLTLTIAIVVAFRDRGLKQQLRALRILVSYITMTLLMNLYMVSVSGTNLQQISLVLSGATIILLWITVYKLWAKGE